jgi:putative NADH-flavin reductase
MSVRHLDLGLNKMKIIILGATGFSGKAILKEALSKNHQVTAIVRNSSAITIKDKNLTVIEGNVLDKNISNKVFFGQDVVIQCLGIGGQEDGKPNSFVSDVTKIIVEEMKNTGVKKLIVMSNVGAGNSRAFQPWFFNKIILPYFMKWLKVIIEDKNIMEPIVMDSDLDWTIVRCPNIVDKPSKGKYLATLDGKNLKFSITLYDMAAFIVNQITDKSFIRQAPCISN